MILRIFEALNELSVIYKHCNNMDEPRYTVSAEELKDEFMRRKYCELLAQPEVFPSEENWAYIISRRMTGLGPGLYRKYLVAWLTDEDIRSDYHQAALRYFPEYINAVPRDYAIETVYGDSESSPEAFTAIVYKCQLFDAEAIGRLLECGKTSLAVDLLGTYQPIYDGDAVDAMRYLLSRIDRQPNLGDMQMRRGLFRSEQVYVCPDGHSNPADTVYCRHDGCGKDIKGLREKQRVMIEEFRTRIAVLSDMLA